MSQLNTIALRDTLIGRVTDFALDDHFVTDPDLNAALREIWSGRPETGGLGSDLWVEGAFPPISSTETMEELVKRGLVRPELAKQLNATGVFPSSLRPYQHQLESIESSAEKYPNGDRPAIVVTAGTGAGKTESFLIPLLNELWGAEKEAGGGISALILYPMNALVNDQVGRLDKWLSGQKQLSFFHFTSETPENDVLANKRGIPKATPARFRTRQQARGYEDRQGKSLPNGDGPTPDVLVTNYSMLEYMLCRPQDGAFFGTNLRVIVLDEAHIYSGNLAAEITLLLRRVLMRCGRRPEEVLFIATSATIGGGIEELKPFAAKLFTKPESLVRVITGKPKRPKLKASEAKLPLPSALGGQIAKAEMPDEETLFIGAEGPEFRPASEDAWRNWKKILSALVPDDALKMIIAAEEEKRLVAPTLAQTLTNSSAIAALQEILWANGQPIRIPLRKLAETLFSDDGESAIEATRRLLQMGAIARQGPGSLPLLPNRMHYLLRGPEGIQMAFGGIQGEAMHGIGEEKRVFSTGADPAYLGSGAIHPLTVFRCHESGWWGVAGKQTGGKLEPVPISTVLYGDEDAPEQDSENPNAPQPGRIRFYSLEEVPGRPLIHFNPQTGGYGASGPVCLWEVVECPKSGAAFAHGSVGWFAARARLQLSVVAETALSAMPEFPEENRVWKPARGRRLLVFSDSRAEAARLGPRLTRQHELQVFRAAVLERLNNVNLAGNEEELEVLREEVRELQQSLEAASQARRPILERRLKQAQDDLKQMTEGGSVADWTTNLKDSAIVRELFDAPGGKSHQPGTGNAHDAWDRNSKALLDSLPSLLGRELARRPAWPNPSLETLGLVEVTYPGLSLIPPPNGVLGLLPSTIAKKLEKIWPDYLAALLDAVRNQGAITLGSEDDDRDYQYGNGLLGKRFSALHAYRRSLLPLIGQEFEGPQASRRNAFTRNVLLAIGVSESEATPLTRNLMQIAFDSLCAAAREQALPWLKLFENEPTDGDSPVTALQIQFRSLGLRRPTQLYRCEHTGQIWPRSVAGFFPGAWQGSLREVASTEIDNDPRVGRRRRELRDWLGFKLALWAEEHSAQLSPEENARLQNLFREGMRNILSSTTTLELGIDIGGLSAVLLGNLPPGKANYLQRAGRAGRRSDGTSAVLGFARPSTYEREVFLDFRRYLDRELRRPTVFLDRVSLVRRHAHAWLLGEFFRTHFRPATGAMDAYGRMGAFTGQFLPGMWTANSAGKPVLTPADVNPLSDQFLHHLDTISKKDSPELRAALKTLWEGCPIVQSLQKWTEAIQSIHDEFEKATSNWKSLYEGLLEAWKAVPETANASTSIGNLRAQANSIFFQLQSLYRLTVIEALADERFLPRYGFPIGLSRLRVQVPDGNNRPREEDQFRLQRDSMMAMREYAPGSQLLVGGQIVTSRGLLKHWTGSVTGQDAWGLRGRFKKSGDGYFSYSLTSTPPDAPPSIAPGQQVREGVFLFPKHGFTTAAWDPPRFGSDFERIGKLAIFTLAFENLDECDAPLINFGEIAGLTAVYRNAGELFLMNSGANEQGFAICQKCGYAESEFKGGGSGRTDLPRRFEWHSPLNATKLTSRCWTDTEAPVWRNHHLAAKQATHLLRLDFSSLGQALDRNILYTLGQALRITAARALEQDEREIGLIDPVPDPFSGQYRSVILYDSLAGGSGHLAELSHPENPLQAKTWLAMARAILTVEGEMPDAVRHRESIRRLLTADCDDSRLVPELALNILAAAFVGGVQTGGAIPPAFEIPGGAWTVERLAEEVPPQRFPLYFGPNEIAGLAAGVHDFEWQNTTPTKSIPQANSVVVVRLPGETSLNITLGKWFYTQMTDSERPHHVKLRRLQNPVTLDLTEEEFLQLRILAIKAP